MVATSTPSTELPFHSGMEGDPSEMETPHHAIQSRLLIDCIEQLWETRDDFVLGQNNTVRYIDRKTGKKEKIGPDIHIVRGVPRQAPASWVAWEQGDRYPDLVIELLSEKTADNDRGTNPDKNKKAIYQDQFQTLEYFWFAPTESPKTKKGEFAGFRLVSGKYEPIRPNASGWLWSEVLASYLGLWSGVRSGIAWDWLRLYSADGTLVPTEKEQRDRAEAKAKLECQKRERAEAEKNALLEKLKAAGIDPDTL